MKGLGLYTLKFGVPVPEPDVLVWEAWMQKADRHVGNTTVGGLWVSTVFLGLDHEYGNGPPLLFETMVFDSERGRGTLKELYGWDEYDMWRYSTLAEALEGHSRVVARVEAALASAGSVYDGGKKGTQSLAGFMAELSGGGAGDGQREPEGN